VLSRDVRDVVGNSVGDGRLESRVVHEIRGRSRRAVGPIGVHDLSAARCTVLTGRRLQSVGVFANHRDVDLVMAPSSLPVSWLERLRRL
jgi:hypothetical protein